MRRDMNLIRNMLVTLEQHPGEYMTQPILVSVLSNSVEGPGRGGWTAEEISAHVVLLRDMDYVEMDTADGGDESTIVSVRLTWQGYDYLDAIAD